jgi:hypothetical protein
MFLVRETLYLLSKPSVMVNALVSSPYICDWALWYAMFLLLLRLADPMSKVIYIYPRQFPTRNRHHGSPSHFSCQFAPSLDIYQPISTLPSVFKRALFPRSFVQL